MKKQIAAVMLAATLLPCNVYASENINNSYQIGLLSYELSSDWTQTESSFESQESLAFQTDYALLEITAFEFDLDAYLNKDEFIDAGFQMIADRFSELDGYEEIYREATRSSLNTQADLLTFTFDSDTQYNVNIAYNLYYENSIYSMILVTSPDLVEDYSNTISDFDASLKPVEIISDAATVQKVQEALNQKGYSCGTPDGIAGANTESAVKSYQKDFNLLETGKITNKLLESLSIRSEEANDYVDAGLLNSEIQTEVQTEPPVETPVESPIGKTVWIPNTGSKYHSKASCSNMKNPSQVSIEDAQAMGYTPCKKCY